MGFIEGLPRLEGFTTIFTVVHRLSKYAHFMALWHPHTTVSVASIFLREVVHLHGMLESIVSDRDQVFISKFLLELFRLQGTVLKRSMAYHPQINGQTKVVNRGIETCL